MMKQHIGHLDKIARDFILPGKLRFFGVLAPCAGFELQLELLSALLRVFHGPFSGGFTAIIGSLNRGNTQRCRFRNIIDIK
ncbi:MAG: hypothetical protein JW863_14185 [Chitinispirillaceae bacterium]|nr:hypothetical protein [Chitinispirillaceae bacterium]